MRRALKIAGIAIGIIGLLIIIAVVTVTMTPWGHERLREKVVEGLDSKTRGRVVKIGKIKGNLLSGITIADVWIGDRAGNVFITADSVTTRYGLRYMLRKRVVLTDMRFVKPLVILEKKPGERYWNYRKLFGKVDTLPVKIDSTLGFGDWIRFERVEVVDGRFLVRRPWEPKDSLTGHERDAKIAHTLAGGSRTNVVAVEGGFQQITDFRSIYGRFPLILLKDPEIKDKRFVIDSLRMLAAPFNPPVLEVRNLAGEILFNGDSLWFTDTRILARASRVKGSGAFNFDSKDLTLRLRGEPIGAVDLQWIYPRIPADGEGTLDFALMWRGDVDTYTATNANVRLSGARADGDFGLTLGPDSLYFHDTDMRFAGVETRLIQQFVPAADFPRHGAFGGRAALNGSFNALALNADVTFDESGAAGRSRVTAVGGVGVANGVFRANDLRLGFDRFHLDLLTVAREDLPVFGTLSGKATVGGSTATRMNVTADIAHDMDGAVSRIAGRGAIRMGGRMWIDIDAEARPIALAAVGKFVPKLGLQNFASGPITVSGTLDDLRLRSRLRTTDGGVLAVESWFDLQGEKRYDVALGAQLFNANLVLARAPATSLTARAAVKGTGFDPATLRATASADILETSTISDLGFDSASVRLQIAEGLVRVDTMRIRAPAGDVDAEGTIAIAGQLAGELNYRVALDSLTLLNRWLGGDTTGVVEPRPARRAKIIAAARADSAALADSTEVERAVTGRSAPKLVVNDTPTVVRRDSISGALFMAGTVRGTAKNLNVTGRAGAENLVARGYTLRRGQFEYTLTGIRSPSPSYVLAARMDTATAAGFQLDSVEARIAYRSPNGEIDVLVHQHENQTFRVQAGFALHTEHNELHLAHTTLDIDTTRWQSGQPGTIQWGANGLTFRTIELRSQPHGRIYVDGRLPARGDADLQLEVTNLDIGSVTTLLQSDLNLDGRVSLEGRLRGTRASPRFEGAFGAVEGKYGRAVIPDLHSTLVYANRKLDLKAVLGRDGGAPLATVNGSIPVNLALTSVSGGRWLDQPMNVELVADSLPIDIISEITGAVQDVSGRAIGFVTIRGTGKDPRIAGAIGLERGYARIPALGVIVRNIAGNVRMRESALVIDSLVGYAGGPVRITGGLDVSSWTAPEFDLRLLATNARMLDSERGRLRADATLTMEGPYDAAYVTGDVHIRNGVIYIPESDGKSVIGTDDPAIFSVLDTSVVTDQDLFPGESPLLDNLRMDVSLAVSRDTWVRSKEANVEVYTTDPISVHVDRRADAGIVLDGAVNTDRGQYTFLSRRFEIRRGSATFIGGPELNPTLQVTGELPVRGLPSKEAFTLRVIIGGTLDNMKLSLESDAQPPLNQTELLSYLAFGDASGSILPQQGSALAAGSGGTQAGSVGTLAVRKYTSMALGMVVDELEGTTAQRIGADVFNIAPTDIPTELSAKNAEGFLSGTEVEAGWYVDRNTYLGVQKTLSFGTYPGVLLQRRLGKGYFAESTLDSRYLLREPTLRVRTDARPVTVFGLFLGREWRF